jgi:AcrR family transcriptional regulator
MQETLTTRAVQARPTKRIRRTAAEARRLILDAAEKRLAEQGPEGIRLQDIAKDIGVSHPAILHHFESRDGLVKALIRRSTDQLRERLLAALPERTTDPVTNDESSTALLEGAFEALSDKGTARLLAWLLLTGKSTQKNGSPTTQLLTEISDQLHERRVAHVEEHNKQDAPRQAEGSSPPASEDSYFMAMLVTNAAVGEAIMGKDLYQAASMGDGPDAPVRFRHWLAKLLKEHALRTDFGHGPN